MYDVAKSGLQGVVEIGEIFDVDGDEFKAALATPAAVPFAKFVDVGSNFYSFDIDATDLRLGTYSIDIKVKETRSDKSTAESTITVTIEIMDSVLEATKDQQEED